MGIFSRVTDIANANINALLDKAEDPEKMVRMMIIEMEETLVEVRTTSARMLADKKTLKRKAEQLSKLAHDWENKAALALQKEREDLARAALLEKHDIEQDVVAAERELDEYDTQLAKLGDDIEQLQLKLADAKARQKTLVMRADSNRSRLEVRMHLRNDGVDEALAKFERYERKLDELEGQVEAYDLGRRDLHDAFTDLENEGKVDADLAELKARMKKAQSEQ